MFLAFLRVGEAASLRKKHLVCKGNGVWWVHIARSKTDQQKRGNTVAFNIVGQNALLWTRFQEYLDNISEESFIFAPESKYPPTTDLLRKRVNAVLQNAGIGHKGLTPHSFRGGAATAAIRSGVTQDEIKRVALVDVRDYLAGTQTGRGDVGSHVYFGFNFLPTGLTGFLIHMWKQTKKVTGAGISRFSSVFPHLFFAYPNPAYLIPYI
ncbi:hypothetical protein Y032_0046g1335 [Ancylostoma ceylanicum]|uniref:Tyr recombinase domain-containing protein n=1 Tax=Ancylostoma ceylanicum TaxID=53326 RepID=A0A016UBF3_9BILA|nr:hypothetical protein Y032_0046g1335 [Ancylostoma ceylanicum]